MQEDIRKMFNTVLIGLNNIDVRGKQNVKNLSSCIELVEELAMRFQEELDKAKET